MVSPQIFLKVTDRSNQSTERRCHVRKVGNPSTHDEDLTLGVFRFRHETNDRFGVLVCMFGTRRSRILTVIGELVTIPEIRNRIGVHDTSTTARYHGPDASRGIEDGEL